MSIFRTQTHPARKIRKGNHSPNAADAFLDAWPQKRPDRMPSWVQRAINTALKTAEMSQKPSERIAALEQARYFMGLTSRKKKAAPETGKPDKTISEGDRLLG